MRLYLHTPTVVFAARVNQSAFQFPISSIVYDTVTTGAYTDIGNSQTILFGSSAGASDLGSSRIRLTPTSTVLYFGLSSQGNRLGEVNPVDNCYITVVDTLLVFSKVPYIDADGEMFFDGDIAYTNQNEEPPPVANCGPPFADEIDSGTGLITVNLSGTASFATAAGETITDYLWDVQDGTITVGADTDDEITATFGSGFRYIRLTVTDGNGKQHNAYTPILAIDPDDDPTIDAFQITRHTITPEGQDLDIRLLEDVSLTAFPAGGMVLVIDGTPVDGSDRENILFYGWADTEDADLSAEDTGLLRDTTIHCLDVAGRLKQLPGYSQVLTHVASPTKWSEASFPDLDLFMWYILYWQSTALALADFTWTGTSTAYAFAEIFADGSNLWDQVARKAQSMMPDRKLVCNRRGQLAIRSDPLIMETGSRPLSTQANLTIADWQSLSFTEYRNPRVSWLRAGALLASNTIIVSLFSIAPGTSPGQGSAQSSIDENIAVSQTTLNAAAGHHYARLNAPQGLFTVTLPNSDNLSFDPARMDWVKLTITAEVAAQRGLTFSEARFLLHQLDVRYTYGRGGIVRTNTLRLERETVGIPAVTYVPAIAEPVDGDTPFVPPVVPGAAPGFDGGLPVGQDVVGFIDRDARIWTCPDFTTPGEPTWSRNTAAATAASLTTGSLRGFIVDPFSPGYRGVSGGDINGFVVSGTTIYKVTDLFGTPSYTSLHSLTSAANLVAELSQIGCSFGRFQATESDNPWLICVYNADSGVGPMRVYVTYSVDGGQTWSSEIDVTGETRTQVKREWSRPAIWMSPRTPGLAVVGCWATTGTTPDGALFRTADWGATWAAVTDLDDQGVDMGLGFSLHVPWLDNLDERVAYYGAFNETSNVFNYGLWRSVAGTATDISPTDGGKSYGPVRNQFGVRSLDTNRQYMLLAGAADNVDDVALLDAGSDGVTALWKSSNGGDSWTRVTTDATTDITDDCVLQAAFSSDDPNTFYAWGNHGYLIFTQDGGSVMTDKSPTTNASTAEILGIFGGGS